ncbi:nucleotidyltransferase domain-containing protein [Edaphobacter modestus]|uniref:nucleotidyltransferase domain-containing protein n=1 Tax=Edaphobacter modestus TaxID=388466 RepID=UPI003BF9110B
MYRRLGSSGIEIWIDGGWGVDALLGHQTRVHPTWIWSASLLADITRTSTATNCPDCDAEVFSLSGAAICQPRYTLAPTEVTCIDSGRQVVQGC